MENSKCLSFRDHFLPEILSHWDFTVKVWLQPDTRFVLKTISCAAWLRNLNTTHWASLWREMSHFNEPPQGDESRTLPNGDSVLCFVLKIAHGTLATINVSAITVITVWSFKNGKASLGESKTHISLKHSLLCTQEREQPCWLGVRAPLAGSRRGFFASSSLPLAVSFTKHSLGEKGASRHQPGESESESLLVVSDSLWPHGLYSAWNSPGQNTGMESFSLLQGIFPTQGSNPGLLRCRRILYQLSHKGSRRTRLGQPIPSPADCPGPGIELGSLALQADSSLEGIPSLEKHSQLSG